MQSAKVSQRHVQGRRRRYGGQLQLQDVWRIDPAAFIRQLFQRILGWLAPDQRDADVTPKAINANGGSERLRRQVPEDGRQKFERKLADRRPQRQP